METKTQGVGIVEDSSGKLPVVKKPGALKQVFGHFTRPEFWIELLEGIVKASVAAFFVAVGQTLIGHAKKSGASPDTLAANDVPRSPAADAFSRGYNPSTYNNPYSSRPQPPVPVNNSTGFPGF